MVKPDDWDLNKSGKKSDAKIIYVHLYPEEGIDQLYSLTQRQTAALIKIATYLRWVNRFDVIPTDLVDGDNLEKWNNDLALRLMNPMEICAEIINCLNTDEDVQDAFKNFVNGLINEALLNGSPISDYNKNRGMGGYNGDCSLDIVWAQSRALVVRVNAIITDLVESIQEGDTIAKLGGIVASFPVLENIGLSSVTSLASFLFDIAAETYADDYTLTWEEETSCAIFCTARDTCEITFANVFAIFKDRVETAIPAFIPPADFTNLAEWITRLLDFGVEFNAINKADALFYFIFGGLAYGNVIINNQGLGQKALDTALMLAADEPSNDWEILCLTCPEYEHIFVDPNPYPVEGSGLVLIDEDGTFTGGDNRKVITPFQATITLPVNRRLVTVTVTMAFAEETGNEVTVEGIVYPLVRGTHIGGSTYDYVADIPNVMSTNLEFQFAANAETSFTFVVVSMFDLYVWAI